MKKKSSHHNQPSYDICLLPILRHSYTKCAKSIHMHASYQLLRILKRNKLPTILVSQNHSNFLERNNFEAGGEKNESLSPYHKNNCRFSNKRTSNQNRNQLTLTGHWKANLPMKIVSSLLPHNTRR